MIHRVDIQCIDHQKENEKKKEMINNRKIEKRGRGFKAREAKHMITPQKSAYQYEKKIKFP